MLAKLPQLVNGRGKSITELILLRKRNKTRVAVLQVMGKGNDSGYWAPQGFLAEGFLMEELFHGGAQGPVYADRHLLVTHTEEPAGLRFTGEIDVSNSEAVGQAMRLDLADLARPHLDLSGLTFSDVSGLRAMVGMALTPGEHRLVLLHGLPKQLGRVLELTGWSDLPAFEVCNCQCT